MTLASSLQLSIAPLLIFTFEVFTAFPSSAQASGTWTATASPNTARTEHTATLLPNGKVLIAGGRGSAGPLASAELCNPATGTWTITGSMSTARSEHTATLLPDGEVLVTGGVGVASGSEGDYIAGAELYNPAAGTWRATGTMTVPRAFHGAVLLADGEVLVAGGSNLDGTAGNTAELYNPATGTWKDTGAMPIAMSAPATLLQNGTVLIAGGDGGEVYHPLTGQWTETPPLYYLDSTGISATLLPSGDVLIYGNKFSCYAAQFFNPNTDAWNRTIGQCGNSVSSGPLVLLPSGEVLLAGGIIRYSGKVFPTALSSLYNPATNTWTRTGSLKQPGPHSATLLPNGRVLAVGEADAEIFTP